MKRITPSEKIYIDQSAICDERGVFALIPIQKGELIERCPVIEISADDTAHITEESLVTYMYFFGEKKERSALALGCGSIYNHTNTPNAMYKEIQKEKVIEFWAIKDIKKGEEITVNYGQANKEETRPLWFVKS